MDASRCLIAVLSGLLLAGYPESRSALWPGKAMAAVGTECSVPPRNYADISALLMSPPAATPPATTDGETLERGEPASDEERFKIHALITEWLACQNEGRLFSSWALFSDAYLYRLISRQGKFPETLYDDWATPASAEASTATLLAVSNERRLHDGRLGATVQVSYASVPMPKQFFFYFVVHDDSLLIDSILGEISFSVP